jgi:putative flippase GtrA
MNVTGGRWAHHRELLGQLIRYAISGGLSSMVHLGLYWSLAEFAGVAPLVSNGIGFVVALIVGYMIHSRWSFRGHGRRGNIARTGGRFVAVNLVGLALNSFWVWLLVEQLGGATWWPMPLMVTATPLAVFWLNRKWVFA